MMWLAAYDMEVYLQKDRQTMSHFRLDSNPFYSETSDKNSKEVWVIIYTWPITFFSWLMQQSDKTHNKLVQNS